MARNTKKTGSTHSRRVELELARGADLLKQKSAHQKELKKKGLLDEYLEDTSIEDAVAEAPETETETENKE